MLSPEREGLTTASEAPRIVHGTPMERYTLWLEKTHQQAPADLSDVFPVQWGKHGEPFILDWIERVEHREISERGRFIKHPDMPIGCTLDGYRPWDDAVVECKVLGPFATAARSGLQMGFVEYYAPQVVVQMICRGAARGWLAVQQGNSAPQMYEVHVDDDYRRKLLALLLAFHGHVTDRTPPGPPPPAPVPPEKWRVVSLDAPTPGDNWGPAMIPALRLWSDTRETAQMHEQAKKDVKLLLPADVGLVTYQSISVKRARNGAVTISEATEEGATR